MFEQTLQVGVSTPWPEAGMPSGVGLRNPPLSIWVFVALSQVFGIETPMGLSRMVAGINALGMLILTLWAMRRHPQSLAWTLGLALAWVSPQALLLERKIWAQSLLPGFTALLWILWGSRSRFWGAFAIALGFSLLGQIHLSGWFALGGLGVWLLIFEWPGLLRQKQWLPIQGFALGGLVSLVPLLPWLGYLLSPEGAQALSQTSAYQAIPHSFWDFWRHWVSDALGVGLDYSLGPHLAEFQNASPTLFSLSQVALFGLLSLAVFSGLRLVHQRQFRFRALEADSLGWIPALLFVMAGLLILAGTPVHRHYLLITYPGAWLLLAWVLELLNQKKSGKSSKTRKLSILLWIAFTSIQATQSVALLDFLERQRGAPQGDFGVSLRGLIELQQGSGK